MAPSTVLACLGIRRARAAYQQTRRELAVARDDATHDSLTGLANRRAFYEQAARMVAAADPQRHLAVALIDVDNFKAINDTHGHGVGDLVLVAVASRLRERLPEAVVARLDGDEFAVIAPLGSHASAEGLATRLMAAADGPVVLPTTLPDDERLDAADVVREIALGVAWNIGVALVAEPGDLASVLGRADAALYAAKSGTGVAMYGPVAHDDCATIPGQRPAARTRDLSVTDPSSFVAGGFR